MQNHSLFNVDKLHHRVLKTNVIQDFQGNNQMSDNSSEGLHNYITVDVDKQYLDQGLIIHSMVVTERSS